MTAYVEHFDRSYRTGFFSALGARLERLGTGWAEYKSYRTTRNELAQLSDRELADIGLTRDLIDAAARTSIAVR